ncbi:MAG: type I secretion system permease/ATPase [Silicimonas sp.]|nr:type I secretion system permease/ATPase [Silicimonas sp.]
MHRYQSASSTDNASDAYAAAAAGSRHFLAYSFFFSVFVNILMLTGPLFMLQIYDRVLRSRSEETLAALLVLVLALYALMWLLDFARTRLVARYGARFQSALDAQVFRAQLTGTGAAPRPGALTATRDLEAIQAFYASPALTALMDAPFTPVFLAAIYLFHPWLGWFALAGGLVLIAVTTLNQMLTAGRVAEAQATAETAHRFADNARQAADLIRSQGMLLPVTARWMDTRVAALSRTMSAVDWTGAFSTFSRAFRLALQSLILALGAWLVLAGELTAGAMIAASILLGRALAPIEQIIGRWPQIARARDGRRALKSFLSDIPDEPPRTRLSRPSGALEVRGVTITAGPGRKPLLYNVGFTMTPGEALGVVGRSGSGKTTIARTLLRLVEPTIGEVRLGGALIAHYPADDLGAFVGYLPQDPMLITGTIAENIALMSLAPDSSMVVAAAKKASAHDLILSLPEGYDTRVEDNTIGLSGGQRQRIALARALYGDPVLLVLDEPNSALDQEGSEALNAAVRQAKSEARSVIIMTHRPVAISECDRLMVIEAGTIKALGPRDEIVKSMMRNAGDIQRVIAQGAR